MITKTRGRLSKGALILSAVLTVNMFLPNVGRASVNEETQIDSQLITTNAMPAKNVTANDIDYFNPKPTTNDTITIPLYITDFEQSEYLKNDNSGRMDLLYEVDGVKKTIKSIPLGDYTLTLGKLSEGMHQFAVQAVDPKTGLKSHKLYNELWVVNPSKYNITKSQTYTMTEADLKTYKIKNNNSKNANDLINTRDGLSKLFADKQAEGYKKIVLLKGTYRVNGDNARKNAITIPSYFTVDMNGSTFKLDTIDHESGAAVVTMLNAVDAHLINGTLEGDRFERQELGLECKGQGEGINTIYVAGGKYCSLSDLTVQNTTGHTLLTMYYQFPGASANITMTDFSRSIIVNGKEQASANCSTSAMMDLTPILKVEAADRYMYVGHPGGYKGQLGDSPVIYVSFYDANRNFLETVTGYQFRKMKIVDGAKYARVTLLGTQFPYADMTQSIHIYSQQNTDYFEINNIHFIDTRTTALAPTAVTNLLIRNCKFTRCGCSITPCEVDFEDGQEECQDVYYMNNQVLEKSSTNTCTVVDNIGYNHVYDGNKNHSTEIRNRVIGAVIRNVNDGCSRFYWRLGYKDTGAYGRIYNNNCGPINFSAIFSSETDCVSFRVKNCTIYNQDPEGVVDTTKWTCAVADKVTYEDCVFPWFAGSNATFVNCTLVPAHAIGNNLYFYNCTIGADGVVSQYNLSNIDKVIRVFDNCHFAGKTEFKNYGLKSGTFTNCTFDDFALIPCVSDSEELLIFENCKINSTYDKFLELGAWTYSIGNANIIFRNCSITHTGKTFLYITSSPLKGSQILFDNCTINKYSGTLLSGYRHGDKKPEWLLNIIFSKTETNQNLTIDEKNIDYDVIHIIYDSQGTLSPAPTKKATPVTSVKPTISPTKKATPKPTTVATPKPTGKVTVSPAPTKKATPRPTGTVTRVPTVPVTVTPAPTKKVTPRPTGTVTLVPTTTVTPRPTRASTPTPTPDVPQTLMPDVLEMNYRDAKSMVTRELKSAGFKTVNVEYVWKTCTDPEQNLKVQETDPAPNEVVYLTDTSITVTIVVTKLESEPMPTSTPCPTSTPVPTDVPGITATPVPTKAATPVPSKAPTKVPTSTPTGSPSVSPVPTEPPTIGDFIERLYTIALDRESEPEGKEFWVNEIESGNRTGGDCAHFFLIEAQEFLNRGLNSEDFVETLYCTFFDRASEAEGKKFWVGELKSGRMKTEDVINGFIDSTEWCNVCATYGVKSGAPNAKAEIASLNAIEFATRLYTCCLDRDPDPKGVEYWSLALTNLEQTGYSAASEFFTSKEFLAQRTSNVEYVERLYKTFLGRDPLPSEASYWSSQLENRKQTRQGVLEFFGSSEEFIKLCKEYGID